MKNRLETGFTIVELLIVIVVIGILAAITMVAYNGIQDRARAAAVTSGIQNVERAFQLMNSDRGLSTWPIDEDFGLGNNPNLAAITSDTDATHMLSASFKQYLKQVPATPGATTTWLYDNDGDSRDPSQCNTGWASVILAIQGMPLKTAQAVDKTIDDGDTTCGRVLYTTGTGGTLLYQLSSTQAIQ